MNRINILFVTHDFTKTGAPVLLLRIITALRKLHPEMEVSVACVYDRGELKQDYLKVADIFFGSIHKLTFVRKKVIQNHKFTHIFLNTIVAGEIIKSMKELKIPIYSWIHEMPHTIEQYGVELLEQILHYSLELFVVDKTTEFYAQQIAKEKNILSSVQMLRGCISSLPTQFKKSKPSNRFSDENPLKLVSMGPAIWRKGIYDIPKLIDSIKHLPVQIYWYGAEINQRGMREIHYSLMQMNLEHRFEVKGFTHDVPYVFEDYDVFFAISNEEPGPLTILEASSVGLPTICWDSSIGLSDFTDSDAGWVLPYQDFDQFRVVVEEMIQNPELIYQKGKRAFEKVKSDFSAECRANQLYDLLQFNL